MAETALVAFGRYVKMLRERKGLSLDDAVALTRIYPDPLNKGYLSRVENGRTRVGFDKMIAIARAYDVPVDVFAERLWLDLELDRMDPPDTSGLGLREMVDRAAEASARGLRWRAYAYLRDAVQVGREGPVIDAFRDRDEQVAIVLMNCATAASRLGALNASLHELRFVESLRSIGPKYVSTLSTHLSWLFQRIGDNRSSSKYADRAIAEASTEEGRSYLGACYVARGLVAYGAGELDRTLGFYQEALRAFRAVGRERECANVLCNIAQAYLDQERFRAALRAADGAERLARRFGLHGVSVRVRLIRGDAAFGENRQAEAARYWRAAADIARSMPDRTLLFKADFQLFRQAVLNEDRDLARAYARKLDRLSPWISPDTTELVQYRAMTPRALLSRSKSRKLPSSN